ncbi:protease HtpX [Simkania negevensis]|uniref:Protease HtpX homolog n=1 Tax=Simkania negevensis (strain ATCC VR-1471 / DSM 27360 / Z) TaxID=331113 RepID=F8L339_SIMNZ|nr:protease HtpX [Simkania negevensis]CCB89677.1 protease HtpX homolog [Simkania negevensis Z]
MRFVKRIFLFLIINFLVVMTISTVLSVLGVKPYLNSYGLDIRSLMIFCVIWGMGGALISLALSRKMAKWLMRVQVIDPTRATGADLALTTTVERLARNAGLSASPEVGIFHSSEPNAFATGPSQKRALVAVSTGLLDKMSDSEIEAVLGHEITHISNGDMVTMTLIQGIVNAFVMFLARILAYALSALGRGDNRRGSFMSFYLLTFVFEILFMILGSMVVAFFSRRREFRADLGGAMLSSKDKMIGALERLKSFSKEGRRNPEQNSQAAINAMMISRPSKLGLLRLFATHPPLDERIKHLRESV